MVVMKLLLLLLINRTGSVKGQNAGRLQLFVKQFTFKEVGNSYPLYDQLNVWVPSRILATYLASG